VKDNVATKRTKRTGDEKGGVAAKYPRHSVVRVLRIPKAIIDQNAGKECKDNESAKFVGVGFAGPFSVEISSAIKYGFLDRPRPSYIEPTERARRAIRPQKAGDDIEALREAVLEAPGISDVYRHYRGENLPDGKFFSNALVDKFGLPGEKVEEFIQIFLESLESAKLLEKRDDKTRVLDISSTAEGETIAPETLKTISQGVKIASGDSCFVVMPFAPPIGDYYHQIYEPAIKKAGLTPVRGRRGYIWNGKNYGSDLARDKHSKSLGCRIN
jgi:hypothetical protein